MKIEEIKAAKEMHYREVKYICRRYADNEIVYAHTFIDDIISCFTDTRDKELNLLIEKLTKINNRIKELDKYIGDQR